MEESEYVDWVNFTDNNSFAKGMYDRMNTVINICRTHLLMAKRGPDPNGVRILEEAIADLDAWEMMEQGSD